VKLGALLTVITGLDEIFASVPPLFFVRVVKMYRPPAAGAVTLGAPLPPP
jgi:hypothetical protein